MYIKMETFINLFLPDTEQLLQPTTYDIQEMLDPNTHRTTFKLNGKTYQTRGAAKTAEIVEEILTYDQPDDIDDIESILEEILNPPYDYIPQEGDMFDLDIHDDNNEHVKVTHNYAYVHKDMYDISCPHVDQHHRRHYADGLISCDIPRLATYLKIMKWYRNNKHKIPFKDPPTTVINYRVNKDYLKMKVLIQKSLGDNSPDSPELLKNYIAGTNDNVEINELNKHGLIYDHESRQWVQNIDIKNYIPQNDDRRQIMAKLASLRDIKNNLREGSPIPLINIIVICNHDYKVNQMIRSETFISTVTTYFEGLFQYPNHIFNFEAKQWIPLNNPMLFTFPQIVVNDPNEIFKTFLTIIEGINDINRFLIN